MGIGPGPTSRGIVLVPLQATGRTTTGVADPQARPVGLATAGALRDNGDTDTLIGNHVVRLGTGDDDNTIPGAQISADGKYVLMITNPDDTQDFRTNALGAASTNTAFLLLENTSQVTVGMAKRSTGVSFPVLPNTVRFINDVVGFVFTPAAVTDFAVYNAGATTVTDSTSGSTAAHYVYVAKYSGNLTISATEPTTANAVARSANWAALAAQRRYPNPDSGNEFQQSWAYEGNASKTSVTLNGVASNGDGSQYENAGLSVTKYTTDDIGLVIDTSQVGYATGTSTDSTIVGIRAQASTSSVVFDASFKNGAGQVLGGNSTGVITLLADVAANEDIPHSITGVTLGNQFITDTASNIVNSPFSISSAVGENLEATYSYNENITEGGTTYDTVMQEINNEGDTVQVVPNADVTTISFTA